jgi:NAD(P)-dependent dehydrogenase (short-subunit alcohol dehydrogenase family)
VPLPAAIDFAGRRVVVTGAASGIGAATAALLADLEAEVVSLDVADGSLDLRDPAAVDAAVEGLGPAPLHALLNCAGVPQTFPGPDVLKVNFLGLRHLTEALLPRIAEGGAVASVASLAGQGWPQHLDLLGDLLATGTFAEGAAWVDAHLDELGDPYFFSKEAVIVWTRRRARAALRSGVRMNTVSPGPVDSPMMPAFREALDSATIDWTAREANGRLARPDEMALPLAFLCAPGASYVSGIELVVDAGFTTAMAEGQVDLEGLSG